MSRQFEDDDYTDAEAEEGDALELEAHEDHDAGYVDDCSFCDDELLAEHGRVHQGSDFDCRFCAMERAALDDVLAREAEAVRADMRLDALIALFVIEPCEQDREAARRVN